MIPTSFSTFLSFVQDLLRLVPSKPIQTAGPPGRCRQGPSFKEVDSRLVAFRLIQLRLANGVTYHLPVRQRHSGVFFFGMDGCFFLEMLLLHSRKLTNDYMRFFLDGCFFFWRMLRQPRKTKEWLHISFFWMDVFLLEDVDTLPKTKEWLAGKKQPMNESMSSPIEK